MRPVARCNYCDYTYPGYLVSDICPKCGTKGAIRYVVEGDLAGRKGSSPKPTYRTVAEDGQLSLQDSRGTPIEAL